MKRQSFIGSVILALPAYIFVAVLIGCDTIDTPRPSTLDQQLRVVDQMSLDLAQAQTRFDAQARQIQQLQGDVRSITKTVEDRTALFNETIETHCNDCAELSTKVYKILHDFKEIVEANKCTCGSPKLEPIPKGYPVPPSPEIKPKRVEELPAPPPKPKMPTLKYHHQSRRHCLEEMI